MGNDRVFPIDDGRIITAFVEHSHCLLYTSNCDKNVPGLLMAAARINVPTVFVSGGPMLAGHVKGQKRSLSSKMCIRDSYRSGKI